MAITEERLQQLKAFDESKAGVKGLVDEGITKVPSIFIRNLEDRTSENKPTVQHGKFIIPIVDLGDVAGRPKVVEDIKRAAGSVGFFHVINHGIPNKMLEEMLEGTRRFHELPREEKAEYYSRDPTRKVRYFSSSSLYESKFASWRDSVFIQMKTPEPLDPQELPSACGDITMEYSDRIQKLGVTLFEFLSEALGLKSDHLTSLDCTKEHFIVNHYYPPCPQPELTIGIAKHSDASFLTLLLQDHIGGLQILHKAQWIDVHPVPGSIIVNIGTLLQILSNDKFISVDHRVVAKKEGPRVSVGCFFSHAFTSDSSAPRLYAPIEQLTSKESPPIYRPVTVKEYFVESHKNSSKDVSPLESLKI